MSFQILSLQCTIIFYASILKALQATFSAVFKLIEKPQYSKKKMQIISSSSSALQNQPFLMF